MSSITGVGVGRQVRRPVLCEALWAVNETDLDVMLAHVEADMAAGSADGDDGLDTSVAPHTQGRKRPAEPSTPLTAKKQKGALAHITPGPPFFIHRHNGVPPSLVM